MSDPVVVYLIRHGRTSLNAAGVLRGHLDPPLDAVGRTEAGALGRLFESVPLGALVCSPLQRAVQTAEPIAAATGVSVETDDRLVDRDYGPWAGSARAEIERQFGSLDAAPGVEPTYAFALRVSAAMLGLATSRAPGPVAVVAHDAVNRYALAALVPGIGDPEAIPQRTGCWNRLEYRDAWWSARVIDAVFDDGHRP
jgi:broad specificity phosphatase PhoE